MSQRITDLEQFLLLAVLRIGAGAHAGAVQSVLEERGKRRASLGAIYVTMTRLEERGLVESSLGEPTPERGGKAKRFYLVTRAGRATLQQSRRLMNRMWEGIAADEVEAGA